MCGQGFKVYSTSNLVTITNLFPFEIAQKCPRCQSCVLRENLDTRLASKTLFALVFLCFCELIQELIQD